MPLLKILVPQADGSMQEMVFADYVEFGNGAIVIYSQQIAFEKDVANVFKRQSNSITEAVKAALAPHLQGAPVLLNQLNTDTQSYPVSRSYVHGDDQSGPLDGKELFYYGVYLTLPFAMVENLCTAATTVTNKVLATAAPTLPTVKLNIFDGVGVKFEAVQLTDNPRVYSLKSSDLILKDCEENELEAFLGLYERRIVEQLKWSNFSLQQNQIKVEFTKQQPRGYHMTVTITDDRGVQPLIAKYPSLRQLAPKPVAPQQSGSPIIPVPQQPGNGDVASRVAVLRGIYDNFNPETLAIGIAGIVPTKKIKRDGSRELFEDGSQHQYTGEVTRKAFSDLKTHLDALKGEADIALKAAEQNPAKVNIKEVERWITLLEVTSEKLDKIKKVTTGNWIGPEGKEKYVNAAEQRRQLLREYWQEALELSFGQKVLVAVFGIVCGVIGALALGTAGFVLGSLIGGGAGTVVPGLGNVIGSIAGGSMLGAGAAIYGAGAGAVIGTTIGLTLGGAGSLSLSAVLARRGLFKFSDTRHNSAVHAIYKDLDTIVCTDEKAQSDFAGHWWRPSSTP